MAILDSSAKKKYNVEVFDGLKKNVFNNCKNLTFYNNRLTITTSDDMCVEYFGSFIAKAVVLEESKEN